MESVKISIFLLFFVAFIIVARRVFSGGGGTQYSPDYKPSPLPGPADDLPGSKRPAVIGSELPFPAEVAPVQRLEDGSFNRPNVLNYYFSNLDLQTGPENPRSFCDQLFVQFQAPETGERWTSEYVVATPFGLQELLDQTGQNLTFNGAIIIVPRWSMALILKTVLDDVMEKYAHSDAEATEIDNGPERYQG